MFNKEKTRIPLSPSLSLLLRRFYSSTYLNERNPTSVYKQIKREQKHDDRKENETAKKKKREEKISARGTLKNPENAK